MSTTSLRAVAQMCGCSLSTASRAISGRGNVLPETRARILAAAERQGYRRNLLVADLMTSVRKGRTAQFFGTIAIVHVPSPEQPLLLPTQKSIIRGASDRAQQLGFKFDFFAYGADGMGPARLAQVLRARGIVGIVFIYADPTAREGDFAWHDFACVEVDFGRREPMLNTICIDHYLTLFNALMKLRDQGYRRIGLFLERFKNERVTNRWSGAYYAFQAAESKLARLPVLMAERMTKEGFLAWHRDNRPDLVIGHVDQAVRWMEEAGIETPEETAFFNLNWTARTVPCAGLDLRPELQGSVAVDVLTGQIQRNERGIPGDVHSVMVEGRWKDGRTLRIPDAVKSRATAA